MAEHTKKIHFLDGGTEKTAQLYTSRDDVTPIDGNGQLVSDYPALCVQDGNDTVYAGLVDPLDSNASDLHCTHNGTEYAVAEKSFYDISPVLNDNTIEQIQYAAQNDIAGLYWDIGDYFETTLNGTWNSRDFNNVVVRCVLIGINHNANTEGNHILHFQIGKNTNNVNIGLEGAGMNASATNLGGWNGSRMKSTVLPSIKALLPSNLQSYIKSVTKYSDNSGGGVDTASNVTATTESGLWLLAEFEVFGTCTFANSAEKNNQAQYAYYKNGNSKVRYNASTPTTAAMWWIRSPDARTSSHFCSVSASGTSANNGAFYGNYANSNYMVAPGFCL